MCRANKKKVSSGNNQLICTSWSHPGSCSPRLRAPELNTDWTHAYVIASSSKSALQFDRMWGSAALQLIRARAPRTRIRSREDHAGAEGLFAASRSGTLVASRPARHNLESYRQAVRPHKSQHVSSPPQSLRTSPCRAMNQQMVR